MLNSIYAVMAWYIHESYKVRPEIIYNTVDIDMLVEILLNNNNLYGYILIKALIKTFIKLQACPHSFILIYLGEFFADKYAF